MHYVLKRIMEMRWNRDECSLPVLKTFRTGLSAVNGVVYHIGRSQETWLSEDFRIKCTI